jgi:protein SCO1
MSPRQVNVRLIVLFLSLAMLALAAGATAWRMLAASRLPSAGYMIVLPEPRQIAPVALTDQDGRAFTEDRFKGHWSLVFFGFTSCPDVCPNTLYQLQQVRQQWLDENANADFPQVYLVTVDPQRDTPQKLAAYLEYFDPGFIGLTGATEQVQALAAQLGIAVFVEPHAPEALEYTVDHGASLLLFDPLGQFYAVIPAPLDATSMARDVLAAIRTGGGRHGRL